MNEINKENKMEKEIDIELVVLALVYSKFIEQYKV